MTIRLEASVPRVDPDISVRAFYRRLDRAFTEVERLLQKDMDLTTATWKQRPRFRFQRQSSLRRIVLVATTDSRVWNWLDRGTRAHLITPRRLDDHLIFRGHPPESGPPYPSTYRAATTPNRLSSRNAEVLGNANVNTFAVVHPGVRARNWSRLIREDRARDFQRILSDALTNDLF